VTAAFTFEHVTVQRGDAGLLRDVSVELPAAGITAVVGASGAGKSTLLRCCNRLEAPTAGVVRFRGDDIATLDPLAHRRRVAMVFQSPVVFPGTVFDNLRAADATITHDQAEQLLLRVGIDADYVDRAADTLSGGEAQRVVAARALATDPVALLADEPTSALDDRSTKRLEDLALQLAGSGMTIVWVTHALDQAERIAQHVVVMDGGTVTHSGPIATDETRRHLDALRRDDEEAGDGR
jgi:putative ABC transport system ATP-binding protein